MEVYKKLKISGTTYRWGITKICENYMPHIAIIGAGITGVTTAYELIKQGFNVTVFEKNLYPAMETSFANGGQLSACNAEVWNQKSTIAKGIKWMSQKDAPLLLNPSFNMQKYTWLVSFLNNIKNYEKNTIQTVRLALDSRKHMFAIADQEGFDFNLEKKVFCIFIIRRKILKLLKM